MRRRTSSSHPPYGSSSSSSRCWHLFSQAKLVSVLTSLRNPGVACVGVGCKRPSVCPSARRARREPPGRSSFHPERRRFVRPLPPLPPPPPLVSSRLSAGTHRDPADRPETAVTPIQRRHIRLGLTVASGFRIETPVSRSVDQSTRCCRRAAEDQLGTSSGPTDETAAGKSSFNGGRTDQSRSRLMS